MLADQLSKYFVMARLAEGQSWDVAPWLAPVFRVTPVTNTGVAFGLFRGWGDLFVITNAIVIVAILLYYRQLPSGQWLVRVALSLQLAGAIGNLVDRLARGFVVDFIDLSFWPLRKWPVFNVADSSIVVGVTLLALLMIREEWRERETQQAALDG